MRLCSRGLGQPLADAQRKIRRIARQLCTFSDVAARPQLIEGQTRVYLAPFVEKLVEATVSQQSPVELPNAPGILRVLTDSGRAVLCQGVVPPWMFGEVIDRPQVINEQGPRP